MQKELEEERKKLEEETKRIVELKQIKEEFDTAKPKDEKEEYLLKLVKFYKPLEEYDNQMKELFHMGEHEERLWQMF